jgi:hypothetical protein
MPTKTTTLCKERMVFGSKKTSVDSVVGSSSSSKQGGDDVNIKDLLAEVDVIMGRTNQQLDLHQQQDKDEDTRECVGSLLIPSHDLQELSALTHTSQQEKDEEDTRECVGSLLIPSHDLQELSALTHTQQQDKKKNEDPTRECLGSLLIPSHDLQELSTLTHAISTPPAPAQQDDPPSKESVSQEILDEAAYLSWWN